MCYNAYIFSDKACDELNMKLKHYPLHGVLVVGQVVQTQGHAGRSHGRPRDLQQLLHASVRDELCCKLLMEQQGGQILKTGRRRGLVNAFVLHDDFQGESRCETGSVTDNRSTCVTEKCFTSSESWNLNIILTSDHPCESPASTHLLFNEVIKVSECSVHIDLKL